MKNKIIATVLTAALSLGLMTGCAKKKDDTVVRVGSLKGPTTIGIVNLMDKLSQLQYHYQEILKLDNSLEISFYMHECENSRWSVRELKRQRDSLLFHRLIRNKDKEEVLKLANKGIELQNPEDMQ